VLAIWTETKSVNATLPYIFENLSKTIAPVPNLKGAGFPGAGGDETPIRGEINTRNVIFGGPEGIANTFLGYLPDLKAFKA
jgi:hypothetical protein